MADDLPDPLIYNDPILLAISFKQEICRAFPAHQ
jgi:hypothetical protein